MMRSPLTIHQRVCFFGGMPSLCCFAILKTIDQLAPPVLGPTGRERVGGSAAGVESWDCPHFYLKQAWLWEKPAGT